MTRVLVIGAGGHAAVVGDIILACEERGDPVRLVGYVDDDAALYGTAVLGAPVFGPVISISTIPHDALVVAVGNNELRRSLFLKFRQGGAHFFTPCHPSAVVGRATSLGEGTMICAGAVVNPRSAIADNVILNTGCSVDHDCIVADHAHIAPGVRLGGNVTVGRGAFVGIGAVVMPGRHLGEWSIVGAGALVHRDVASRITVAGVPAIPLERPRVGSPTPTNKSA